MGFFMNIFYLFLCVEAFHLAFYYGEVGATLLSQWALTLLGFKVDLEAFQHLPSKCIAITSHTSIYDFIIASFIYHGYLKAHYDIYFLMKDAFAKHASPICTKYFPYMYIISVQESSQSIVERSVKELKNADNYIMAITPEGTRSCTPQIRSGFYHIARSLDIPVIYVGIDFHQKKISLETPRKMSDQIQVEKEWFMECCRKYIPLYPENCYYTKNFYAEYAHEEEASVVDLHALDQASSDGSSLSLPSKNSSVE
jgi:1-acyl-sn-glycerol-3-phosphate acyltransferase